MRFFMVLHTPTCKTFLNGFAKSSKISQNQL
jgi:hypothetical protein